MAKGTHTEQMGLGMYASVSSIIKDAAKGAKSFSCEDNTEG